MADMDKPNIIEYKGIGKICIIPTDPLSKTGGEKCSYQIPTYQTLKRDHQSPFTGSLRSHGSSMHAG